MTAVNAFHFEVQGDRIAVQVAVGRDSVTHVLTVEEWDEVKSKANVITSALYRKRNPEAFTCRVCGHPDLLHEGLGLTREQWIAHHDAAYDDAREHNADKGNADYYAEAETLKRFGPEPDRPGGAG